MTIMRCFSPCLAVPTGPNGNRESAGDGDGGDICPVKTYGDGGVLPPWGWRGRALNRRWGGGGGHFCPMGIRGVSKKKKNVFWLI